MNAMVSDLIAFLRASPTPYHAVREVTTRLEAGAFRRIDARDPWRELAPGRYFVVQGGSALVAFVVPEKRARAAFRILGAHTDSPTLRLKPQPEYAKEGYVQLGVEVYGGALLNSWLDRDLGLAGRVIVDDGGALHARLLTVERPIVRVAQLAIHLDREVTDKGLVLNKQEHLAPLLGLAGRSSDELLTLVSAELAVDRGRIRGLELMLFDVSPPVVGGLHGEFLFGARLDDLAMCHAGVRALLDAAPSTEASDVVPVLVLVDNEEVGSLSANGAESAFLPRTLERLARAMGASEDDAWRIFAGSTCVSADMAHAVHPNYAERHEARHKPGLNQGPVVKFNAQQRYATSAETAALFEQLCRQAEVPVQRYVHRTDLPCGTTIGPITSALLGIATVDVGNPMLSMHSCRELAGTADPERMVRVLAKYFAHPL